MQRNISFWLSTSHPVSLFTAVLDNACLSVYIHGILIPFLCLGWWVAGGDRNTAECLSLQETEVWRPNLRLQGLLLPERPQIICPLCHIQQPQSCGLPFLRATAPCYCGLCSHWPHSQAGELMKRSIGLLFQLIIWARVTAAPVIEPVMMIWFHQAARIKRTRWLKVVSQWSSAPPRRCGVSHKACQGPFKASHIGHREDVKAQSKGSPQKPPWPWSMVWGPNGQTRSLSETGFTSAIQFLRWHWSTEYFGSFPNRAPSVKNWIA